MSPENNPQQNSPWLVAFNSKILLVGGEVGCLTLIIVLVGVFGGLWLDNLLGTKPLLTVLLVLGSAPISLAITFWIAKRAAEDIANLPQAGEKLPPKLMEGEDET
jgi:hypothetical protein